MITITVATISYVPGSVCGICCNRLGPSATYNVNTSRGYFPICGGCCDRLRSGLDGVLDLFAEQSSYLSSRLDFIKAVFGDFREDGLKIIERSELPPEKQ
jgi:hypothetical protein